GGVAVVDLLDADGVQGPGGGPHPLGLLAAEPEPALLVEVADVAGAMDGLASLADLGEAVSLLASPVGPRDHRPLDRDLADFAFRYDELVAPVLDGRVDETDDPHRRALDRKAHADAGTAHRPLAGIGEKLLGGDAGQRQRLGGAIKHLDLRAGRKAAREPLEDLEGDGSSRAEDAAQGRQGHHVLLRPAGEIVEEG